jgi:hypothetical protein
LQHTRAGGGMRSRALPFLELVKPDFGQNERTVCEDLRAPFQTFVKAITLDVLGRPASPEAVYDWVHQLLSGASTRTVANCLLHSSEYQQKQIREFYERLLGRSPNEEGLDFWTGLLSAGRTQEEVLSAMLSSAEYFNRSGASNARYVKALFQDVLQRRSSDVEADVWIGLLNSLSASRLCIAFDFLTSEEHRTLMIRNWHWRFLRREPAPDAVIRTVQSMKNGASQAQILADLLSSREYFVSSVAG